MFSQHAMSASRQFEYQIPVFSDAGL